jgi:hypothetical protein
MTQIFALFNQPAMQAIIMLVALVVDIVRSLFSRETKQDVHVVLHHLSYDQEKKPAPASFFRTLLHMLLIAILLGMAVMAYLAQANDPTAQAKATVQLFYDEINAKDYQNAYGLTYNGLGHTYVQFTQGFADTKQNDISFTGATTLNDDSTLVGVSITALEVPTTGPRTCHYFAMYHVVSDHGGYVIESGAISPLPCEPAK